MTTYPAHGCVRLGALLMLVGCSGSIADERDAQRSNARTQLTQASAGTSDTMAAPENPRVVPLDPEVAAEWQALKSELDPEAAPSDNFDLLGWTLSIPVDEGNDGNADTKKEDVLSAGYTHEEYFYTADDGGLVFKCPIQGALTSKNTDFTRVELREMLRRGNTRHSTSGVNRNNWVLSSAPSDDQSAAGGIDGTLRATLKVDHVTTTGDSDQVGRVIIGQIHANDDEPVRLYYRLLPGHRLGSIYFAHEPLTTVETWRVLIGSLRSNATEPSDGIALGETFSYEISTRGNELRVEIMREDKPGVSYLFDMSRSGYDEGGQYMYFKAGAYNQNDSGDADDYVQATFYEINASHN